MFVKTTYDPIDESNDVKSIRKDMQALVSELPEDEDIFRWDLIDWWFAEYSNDSWWYAYNDRVLENLAIKAASPLRKKIVD